MKTPEKISAVYRSFYAEMKALEPKRATAFATVQTASNTFSGTSGNVTVSSTGGNNLIVILISLSDAQTVTSVTDNASNAYTVSSALDFAGLRIYQTYGVQINSGATSITVNLSGSQSGHIIANEYSGFSAGNTNASVYNTGNTGSGNGASIATSTFTPSASGYLVVGSIFAAEGSITAGSGYTIYGTSGSRLAMQHDLSATTSETAPASCTSGDWLEIASAFRDNPASGNTWSFFFK